jgi:hypothetical protein
MLIAVNGEKMFTTFTKILTGTSLLTILNGFTAFAVGALMPPFFLP